MNGDAIRQYDLEIDIEEPGYTGSRTERCSYSMRRALWRIAGLQTIPQMNYYEKLVVLQSGLDFAAGTLN